MEILMDLLLMLGGVAVFMFGMKQMCSGLEKSAGAGIRNLFKKIDKNRVINYGIGIGATLLSNLLVFNHDSWACSCKYYNCKARVVLVLVLCLRL